MTAVQVTAETLESPDPNRWKALAVGLTAAFMTLLDVTIVNVALPSIHTGLHASDRQLQWILSGYSLVFGLTLVPAGRLGDARGRRRVFVAGVAAFTLSSAAAGAATSGSFLLAARLIQGLAGGMLTPQVSGLIQQMFPGRDRGRAFGLLGAAVSLSTAAGPLAGGALIAAFGTASGWRWVFYVNVPIGVAAVVLAFRVIPASLGKRRRDSLDPMGVVLLGAGMGMILLPLIQGERWWLLPCALAVLAVFLVWEIYYGRTRTPLVNLRLFDLAAYRYGVAIAATYFMAFTPLFLLFALFLQNGLHHSALRAGLGVTPFGLGSAASALFGGRLVNRFGRPLVLVGLSAVATGLAASAVAVAIASPDAAVWAVAAPWLVAGVGSGLVVTPNQTLTLSEAPVSAAGSAGAVVQTAQRVGAALGIAVITAVFYGASGGDRSWAAGYLRATYWCIAFVLLSMAIAAAGVLRGRTPARPSGSPDTTFMIADL